MGSSNHNPMLGLILTRAEPNFRENRILHEMEQPHPTIDRWSNIVTIVKTKLCIKTRSRRKCKKEIVERTHTYTQQHSLRWYFCGQFRSIISYLYGPATEKIYFVHLCISVVSFRKLQPFSAHSNMIHVQESGIRIQWTH